eukprot:NODE_229_length_2885_cov_17.254888_g213_i0.p1 GENE.NODE_229_length_2885_cov_17.254888_g213_i0~~NODE_229_length_2885_cov_17.254888_g213_i0.p1  ORF type:complete len:588 (+),score=65.45 NODE_229_length_2885_cov_17.254888_g213_i0:75-1838(+)
MGSSGSKGSIQPRITCHDGMPSSIPISRLPLDCLCSVVEYLTRGEFYRVLSICRSSNAWLANHPRVWQSYCLRDWGSNAYIDYFTHANIKDRASYREALMHRSSVSFVHDCLDDLLALFGATIKRHAPITGKAELEVLSSLGTLDTVGFGALFNAGGSMALRFHCPSPVARFGMQINIGHAVLQMGGPLSIPTAIAHADASLFAAVRTTLNGKPLYDCPHQLRKDGDGNTGLHYHLIWVPPALILPGPNDIVFHSLWNAENYRYYLSRVSVTPLLPPLPWATCLAPPQHHVEGGRTIVDKVPSISSISVRRPIKLRPPTPIVPSTQHPDSFVEAVSSDSDHRCEHSTKNLIIFARISNLVTVTIPAPSSVDSTSSTTTDTKELTYTSMQVSTTRRAPTLKVHTLSREPTSIRKPAAPASLRIKDNRCTAATAATRTAPQLKYHPPSLPNQRTKSRLPGYSTVSSKSFAPIRRINMPSVAARHRGLAASTSASASASTRTSPTASSTATHKRIMGPSPRPCLTSAAGLHRSRPTPSNTHSRLFPTRSPPGLSPRASPRRSPTLSPTTTANTRLSVTPQAHLQRFKLHM